MFLTWTIIAWVPWEERRETELSAKSPWNQHLQREVKKAEFNLIFDASQTIVSADSTAECPSFSALLMWPGHYILARIGHWGTLGGA